MKTRGLMALAFAIALAAYGCGGSSSTQQSTAQDFEVVVMQVDGEHLIQGTVFNDLDMNGVMGTGEPGIPGVDVALDGLDATVTDALGQYAFSVTAGSYTVVETDPVGFSSTTPNLVAVTVVDSSITVNFGDFADLTAYPLYGYVFMDMNQNGIMDAGEGGIAGVTISLDGYPDTVTALDGSYAFAVADTGSYTIVETDPDGYVSTTANSVPVQITDLGTGLRQDFGDLPVMDAPVDIKPGSTINPLNLRSKGVLPVAILGSADFDVTQVDPASLLLNGVAPLRWSYEDVCSSGQDDPDPYHDQDVDDGLSPDGYTDLTLKFSTQSIADTLGDVQRGDVVTLSMTGYLMDGTMVSGEETVWIVQIPK